jgi:ABC-type phosphate transport system auxiliary subunit
MKAHQLKIVADGAERLRTAKNHREVKQRLLSEVRQRYAAQKMPTSFIGSFRLEFQIRREVATLLEKEFPSAALH